MLQAAHVSLSFSLSDRKAVLKHHPDKKGDLPAAEAKAADEYFARITKGALLEAVVAFGRVDALLEGRHALAA